MQLAAPFTIAMLGWYAWYETGRKFWLFDFYFFLAVGTLAKGPVAPFLAGMIVLAFAAVRREFRIALRTIWLPGVLLFLAIALPWYVAVQSRNPQFLYVFILQHNLERFATDVFRHVQPYWYYIPVLLLALVPWTFFAVPAVAEALRSCVKDWRARSQDERIHLDSFPEFLVLWALLPIVFFSMSQSKLPGYILPTIAPFTILTADFIQRHRAERLHPLVVAAHAALAGVLVGVFMLFPYLLPFQPAAPLQAKLVAAAVAGSLFAGMYIVLRRGGVRYLRVITLVPVVLIVAYILRIAAPSIDNFYSARPLARQLEKIGMQETPVAVFDVRRDMRYGLAFYRNEAIPSYNENQVPASAHLLLARAGHLPGEALLRDRSLTRIAEFAPQRLALYWVSAKPSPAEANPSSQGPPAQP